ncbi:MAG: STAS domain-containing protein [archaeon]
MQQIEKVLQKKKESIIDEWMDSQKFEEEKYEFLLSEEELREQSLQFFNVFLNTLRYFDSAKREREFDKAAEMIKNLANSRASRGFSPSETTNYILDLKRALLPTIEDIFKKKEEVTIKDVIRLFNLLDDFVLIAFEEFTKRHEEIIREQSEALMELSSPIVSVWDNVLAVPLIGTLDSERTQLIMEDLLKTVISTNSKIAIIDITGVGVVDSQVANNLIKTIKAVRLLGSEAIITGIKPEVAQTIVNLGVNLSNIITKSTLAEGLKFAFKELNVKISKG